ncbi:hypothetical protein [Salinimonas lutimaris]|uniref:hypothetical protein n=1 Tax=Salinimonas lutimaris TaxID=914153 RepID=UPI0010C0EAA1|nr:hypothetical protein [Salinimonas lutimaris]
MPARRFFIVVLPLLFTLLSPRIHARPDYHGSHGMAIIQGNAGTWYAYHMALYNPPHNWQILYQIAPEDSAAFSDLAAGLNTLLPAHFDLQKLIDGQSFSINATIYQGHFERGGKPTKRTTIRFIRPVYRHLLRQNPVDKNKFDTVTHLSDKFVIHRIQPAPSFDAIATLSLTRNTQTLSACMALNDARTDAEQFSDCGGSDVVYMETKDFRVSQ